MHKIALYYDDTSRKEEVTSFIKSWGNDEKVIAIYTSAEIIVFTVVINTSCDKDLLRFSGFSADEHVLLLKLPQVLPVI